MSRRPSRKILWLACCAAVLLLLGVTHTVWMTALGRQLILADAPAPADAVVPLGGDVYGHRLDKAIELVRQGVAPYIALSGPNSGYGFHESDLQLMYALRKGCPKDRLIPIPHEGHSTREEAEVLVPEFRRRRWRKVLIVTSDYHTRRAGVIFRTVGPDIEFRVVACEDEFYRPDAWWTNREAQKTFLLEWTKTAGRVFGF